MKIFVSVLLAAFVFCLMGSAQHVEAWWCSGHMIVAKIAEMNLDPITLASVNANFKYLSAIGPFPEANDMVTAACFADDIKTFGLETMSSWHFVNYQYLVDNFTFPNQNCPLQEASSVGVLKGLVDSAKKSYNQPWISSFALAFVVHLYGDIHQPLHCVDMYSDNYTKGDRGGNLVNANFPGAPAVNNLHGFWDSVCGRWTTELPRPLNTTNSDWIRSEAMRINTTYEISEKSANENYPETMAMESFNLAVSDVYPGEMINHETISVEYQQRCIPVAEKQIFRAGMRLANTLKWMFAYNREHNEVPDYVAQLRTALNGGSNNNNNNAGNNTSSGNEWNGRATGALFGGIVLGVIIVVAVLMVQKYCGNKKSATNNDPTDGYQTVNQNNAGFSRGVSSTSLRAADTV